MRRYITTFIVILSTLAAGVIVVRGAGEEPKPAQADLYPQFEVLARVIKEIQDKYVDEVDTKKLFYGMYKGMLAQLDPYSQFITPEMLEEFRIDTEGEFGGLGIEINIRDGWLTVVTPILGTPAWKAGVLAGDKIIKIEDRSTEGMDIREAVKQLRGPKGTKVTITVVHPGAHKPTDITITRAVIKVPSVQGTRIVDKGTADGKGKIGYVHVTNFQDRTESDLRAAIDRLVDQGMEALILDLRFNPGGLLSSAVGVSDMFISKGVIVATKGRDKSQDSTREATEKGTYKFPLMVLVNRGSASASEIVAGAIQDHRRGILIGERTFGKGSVQSVIPLENNSAALKLTTARYYTPSGRCIQPNGKYDEGEKFIDANGDGRWNKGERFVDRGGIEPDIKVELKDEQLADVLKSMSEAHITENRAPNGTLLPEMKSPKTQAAKPRDLQLQRAIDVLKAWEVFGKIASGE